MFGAQNSVQRRGRIAWRVAAGLVLLAGLVALAFVASPWPGALVIRAVFDRGAATASAKLEKHLPADVQVQAAIRYDPADPDALLDVYRPRTLDPAVPTVVWVHGGGFVSGRRGDVANYLQVLAGRGFAVVNVDYTIAPGATYPKPVAQLMRALAFVDRHAQTLGVQRDAIVLAGDSAGAQIAAQAANLLSSPAYAQAVGIAPTLKPGQLRGALLYCGVFDVAQLGAGRGGVLGAFVRTVTWAYSGRRDWREAEGFERFSVGDYLTGAFPPTFISAGNADPLGPQSVRMDAALRRAGVPVQSLFYPPDHPTPLGHEYQFDLDLPEGRAALDASVRWLSGLAAPR